MISHFLLNLRDLSATTANDTDQSHASRSVPSQVSSIHFNRIIGNLGESLRDESCEEEEDVRDADGMAADDAMLYAPNNDEESHVESELKSSTQPADILEESRVSHFPVNHP